MTNTNKQQQTIRFIRVVFHFFMSSIYVGTWATTWMIEFYSRTPLANAYRKRDQKAFFAEVKKQADAELASKGVDLDYLDFLIKQQFGDINKKQ